MKGLVCGKPSVALSGFVDKNRRVFMICSVSQSRRWVNA